MTDVEFIETEVEFTQVSRRSSLIKDYCSVIIEI